MSATYGKYSLTPQDVPAIHTDHRTIQTALPVPESIPILEKLLKYEPPSMSGQPPILWDRAEGYNVYDPYGNRWIDWSSCVLVSNVGHAHPKIVERVESLVERRQLSCYVFPHRERAEFVEKLIEVAPDGLEKVFLLTTGSEAVECAIKLSRTWGLNQSPEKKVIVSFGGGFHGRTLGSQLAGGIAPLKTWIGGTDITFIQVPFPDGYFNPDTSFELFTKTLSESGIQPEQVAGVISESYLGIGPDFFPVEYAQQLRAWCDQHQVVLTFDEVQAGFGRTGKLFAFEHYDVVPDLIVCGKAISSSLPLSAVIGRSDILSTYPPGSMTSTHSGSPLPVAAGLASLEALFEENMIAHAESMEAVLTQGLAPLVEAYDECDWMACKGLVAGLRIVKPGTQEPNSELATQINQACLHRGLLMFAPVGLGGGCVKIAPPLMTPQEVLEEGIEVLTEAFKEILG